MISSRNTWCAIRTFIHLACPCESLPTSLNRPQNTNQLSKNLKLDFKTVQHHLRVLEKNKFVVYKGGGGFAKIYFPSQMLEDNVDSFNKILQEIEIKNVKKR